ncbi:WD40 repeat-like protein [Aaosphaeria arxii CBS 175.79]|uniref:WD40 repeat-like protein n=1 Tax=Aaosphaeria arxii CBS 175.79 TaxID=1450172 RepID=A0A6A5XXI8_9PLEO|nr:WD40 repeat-like protein [Aaosphaeria arxii CBS 175.79]KAF2018055.1 WD40 repeat-like protein [Aaosphaeria arxii CBS 175.79]
MSKQYLTLHTLESAHPSDIYALAPTKSRLLSASGSSKILVHNTTEPDFPLVQTVDGAHPLGIHHLVTAKEGKRAASVGFEGRIRIWDINEDGTLESAGDVTDNNKPGDAWAIAISDDGAYLASTSITGKINVWSLGEEGKPKIREYETKGSFGLCISLSSDGRFTASGHENGSIYIFNNDSGRLAHSVAGLVHPIRSVAFSPASKLLAAAGDARIIALYDVNSGEQVANLTGHGGWVLSLDWSDTGEYLLSGSHDSKAKIWRIETRSCVATHSHGDKPLWTVKWLPKVAGRSEMFALGGGNQAISLYREAAG